MLRYDVKYGGLLINLQMPLTHIKTSTWQTLNDLVFLFLDFSFYT